MGNFPSFVKHEKADILIKRREKIKNFYGAFDWSSILNYEKTQQGQPIFFTKVNFIDKFTHIKLYVKLHAI